MTITGLEHRKEWNGGLIWFNMYTISVMWMEIKHLRNTSWVDYKYASVIHILNKTWRLDIQ